MLDYDYESSASDEEEALPVSATVHVAATKGKVNRDNVRMRTNRSLQNTALSDTNWSTVRAPIERHIRAMADHICEAEGLSRVTFSSHAKEMLIEVLQQDISLEASYMQECVEHQGRRTATSADAAQALNSFLVRASLQPAPAHRPLHTRYANHDERSKRSMGGQSSAVRQRFAALQSTEPHPINGEKKMLGD